MVGKLVIAATFAGIACTPALLFSVFIAVMRVRSVTPRVVYQVNLYE